MQSPYPPKVAIARWHRNKQGESIEDIAKRDGVTEETVKDSIRNVELFRSKRTLEEANQEVIGTVIEVMPSTREALREALVAENEYEEKGNKVSVPDHSTRLRAVSEVRQLVQAVQPKAGPQIGVQVGVGIQAGRVATGSYIGMEDRLRDIRKLRSEQPQLADRSVTAAVLEAADDEEDDGDEEGASE